jgi:TrmH family RNA methyltransferase
VTPFHPITSAQNSKIKQIKKLRDRRGRERDNLFVIDDGRDLARALDCDFTVRYALYCPALADETDNTLLDQIPADRVYEVAASLMQKASYRQNPGGLLAVMEQKRSLDADALRETLRKSDSPILALVDLRKPGNIGALLRTADASGFGIVCLVDTALDLYNPNIIRSSTGACFLDNVYTLSTEDALAIFREHGYALVAAAVDGENELFETDLRGKVAIALGTEDQGLDPTWQHHADLRVKIPMVGVLSDSLNVSVSVAIFMFEVLRQRSQTSFPT